MHIAEGVNPESNFTSCILSCTCNHRHDLASFPERSTSDSTMIIQPVIFYVHQYSYNKELYVDWGFTFVCNVNCEPRAA